MKKMSLTLLGMLVLVVIVEAQPGGFQRRTVEERVAMVHHRMDSAFKPEPAKLAQIDSLFTGYYKAQDAKREEMMSGGSMPDRETMMAEMRKLSDVRDEKLKAVLTEEQYKTWKEQIEPGMRPQRPPGGGQ